MDKTAATTEFLLGQWGRYPLLEVQDLHKALHQSVFGCGHFVTDEAAGRRLLRRELELPPTDGIDIEPLDGEFCRVHLRLLNKSGLAPETLFRLFALSAETPCGSAAELEEKLAVLQRLTKEGRIPLSPADLSKTTEAWRQAGFPARHHSEAFRAAYAPAYRVVKKNFVRFLPLLSAIDRKLAENETVTLAIEGGSASGKTTLAALLKAVYGCTVFHMDDFFLQPHQRTEQRLAEPGGNVDRERFLEEVLLPLRRGEEIAYRRYDCSTGTVCEPVSIRPGRLNVVEGAYSMHPLLAEQYDLTCFLATDPEVQRKRILQRNGPEVGERFFTQWIPLEERYFEAFDPAGRCDLILEVEP